MRVLRLRLGIVRKVKVGANVPVFVLEYLLGKYCATDDQAAIDAGLKVVNTTLSSNFVRPDEANKAQSLVKDKGKHTLIDKVQVRYVSDDDKHWAELKNFGHKYVHVPEHYFREFDRLLMGGIWAQVEIKHQYDEEVKGKKSPFWIEGLKPIQIASFDLEEYQACRRQFTTDEWIDLLLRTIGMEPSHFQRRLKLQEEVAVFAPLVGNEHDVGRLLGSHPSSTRWAARIDNDFKVPRRRVVLGREFDAGGVFGELIACGVRRAAHRGQRLRAGNRYL